MNRIIGLLFLFVLVYGGVSGQMRFRLSGNSGFFLGEVGRAETEPPGKMSYDGHENFSPVLKPGAELEIIKPITPDFELGIQFGYLNLSGRTPTAPMYNFFLSRHNPLRNSVIYPTESLIFDTDILTIQGSTRLYILPVANQTHFFLRLLGGVSFTGTDFTFDDPFYRIHYDVGTLYSIGTKSSEEPKVAALTGGAGFGVTYRLSDNFDIYFDATASLIHSDIVDGVPNYNYQNNNGQTSMVRTNSLSSFAQASLGLIYSAIPDRKFSKSNYTRSGKVGKSIFRKNKRGSLFNRRKRR